MDKPKKILVIADIDPKDEHVLRRGKLLATRFGAELTVARFISSGDAYDGDKPAAKAFKALVGRVLGPKVVHRIVLAKSKNVTKWVSARCERENYDLVVKSGHRSEAMLYTPTDWKLIRELSVPLLVLSKRAQKANYKSVVATVDVENESKVQVNLNKKVLDWATLFSADPKKSLQAAVCIDTAAFLSDLDLVDLKKVEKRHMPNVKKVIKARYADIGLPMTKWHTRAGVPARTVASVCDDTKADLIVMGSVGRKKLKGLLLGNTAEDILKYINRDVLVVRP